MSLGWSPRARRERILRFEGGRIGRALFPGSGDDDDHLAADLACEPLLQRRERAPGKLLVQLGQLARDQRRPVAQRLAQAGERLRQALRRFVEDELRPERPQLLEHPRAVRRLARQEAGEVEAPFGKTAHAHRRHRCARSRNRHHGDALLHRAAHEDAARIAHRGRTRVGDQGQRLSRQEAAQERFDARRLVEGGEREQGLAQAQVLEEVSGVPRVLRHHRVAGGEHLARPGGDVAEVPDGCRHHVEGHSAPRAQDPDSNAFSKCTSEGPSGLSTTATTSKRSARAGPRRRAR